MREERLISTQEEAYTYPYPTMDMYVHGVKNALKQEGNGGNNLESWLSTISLMAPEEHTKVEARISTNFGKGPIYELSTNHPLPEKIDENTPATSVLEGLGLLSAKLELVRRMDEVPWTVKLAAGKKLKEAEKETHNILTRSSQKIKGNARDLTLTDIFSGKNFSRDLFRRTPLALLLLTACSQVVAKPIEATPPTEKPVASATIEKPTITVEPTSTPTETPEPSPTPEIYTGNPNNIDSWPEKFKNYFVNNPEDQSMDEEFQKFMDKIRMDYLKEKGVEGLEKMDKDEIFFNYLKHTAIDKQKCILTITEIMNIIGDPDISSLAFDDMNPKDGSFDHGFYGIWYNISSEDSLQYVKNQTHTTSVYGRDLLVHRGSLVDMTSGDMVGIVDLPGLKDNYAILLRIRDVNFRNHYVVQRIVGEKMENMSHISVESAPRNGKRTFTEMYSNLDKIITERIVWPPLQVSTLGPYNMATHEYQGKIGYNTFFFDESGIEAFSSLAIPVINYNPKSGEY